MITGIDHVQLAMPPRAEAVAIDFYTGVLGLLEVPKPAALAANGGCWFESADVSLHLGVEEDFRPARKAHPALLVDDLDAHVEAAAASGVDVDRDPPQLEGYRRAFVSDPFGTRIELMERRE